MLPRHSKKSECPPMEAQKIRQSFLDYFASQSHNERPSSSLVPAMTLRFSFLTNAGMVQFKDYFLNPATRPFPRATTCQKCVRAGGKHNDLGKRWITRGHHTFFEMLGNFSFGDYFKEEAIHFAWQWTTEILKLPKSRFTFLFSAKTTKSYKLWHKLNRCPRTAHWSRLGEKDNYLVDGRHRPLRTLLRL